MESQRYFGEEGFKQLVKHIKDLSSEVSQIPQVDASAYSSIFKLVCNGFKPISNDSSVLESTWVSSDAVVNKFLENVKLGDTVILYGTAGPTVLHVTLVENVQVVLQGSSNSFNGNEMTILGVLGPRPQDRQLYGWEHPLTLTSLQNSINDELQALGSRVVTIEGELVDVQSDVSDLKDDVADLQKAIDELDVIDPVYEIKMTIADPGPTPPGVYDVPSPVKVDDGQEDLIKSLFIVLKQNPNTRVVFVTKDGAISSSPSVYINVNNVVDMGEIIRLQANEMRQIITIGIMSTGETITAYSNMDAISDEVIIGLVNTKIITD